MNTCKSDKNRWGRRGEFCVHSIACYGLRGCCERYVGTPVVYILIWFIYHRAQVKYGVNIPAGTKIGPDFKIEHLYGIVPNPDIVIGKNCNIYNGATIGKEKRDKRIGFPQIGDEVWIAPGAYVNFDVPSHSSVLGNPAKVIERTDATREHIKNKI